MRGPWGRLWWLDRIACSRAQRREGDRGTGENPAGTRRCVVEKAPHSGLGCQDHLPQRPSERPKAVQSGLGDESGKGERNHRVDTCSWPLPSAGSQKAILHRSPSPVGVNCGQEEENAVAAPLALLPPPLPQPSPPFLVLQHLSHAAPFLLLSAPS